MYKDIVKILNEGSVEGYIVSRTEVNVKNFLVSNGYGEYYESLLCFEKIAILKSIYVEVECRGSGYGNELLSYFIKESVLLGANLILLIADTGENNDFSLIKWYESKGFRIGSITSNPLMYYLCST